MGKCPWVERLTDHPGIERLDLNYFDVTDADLENLSGLRHLRELDLSHTRINGSGLKHLAGMTELRKLNLSYTQIDGSGLEHLAGHVGTVGARRFRNAAHRPRLFTVTAAPESSHAELERHRSGRRRFDSFGKLAGPEDVGSPGNASHECGSALAFRA